MKSRSYLTLIITLIMLGNAGISVPTAASVNSTQPSTNRNGSRYTIKKYRLGNTVYEVKKLKPRILTRQQVNHYLKQIKAQTWYDIKRERADNLSPTIHLDRKLNRLATIRAEQVSHRFSHYSKNKHVAMTRIDAKRAGLPKKFQGSENIASTSLGKCSMFSDPKTYHNHNGRDMANMSNDGMMNYDEFEQNGHRKNILGSDNTLVGIGAAYNPRKHTFYLAEDFGNEDIHSSENVKKHRLWQSSLHLKKSNSLLRKVIDWVKNRI